MREGKVRHTLLRDIERFSRLFLVKEIGIAGISKLRNSQVVIVGCGATGSHIAELLARVGVGEFRLIDKDYVDMSNLYRTSLFTEEDARKALPKAVACANGIKRIDSSIRVEPVITKLTPANAEELLTGYDIIMDGTDNYLTRFIINDVSVKLNIPWVMSGVETWYGNVWLIDPSRGTPCFRCLYGRPLEDRGNACDILGVVPTAVSVVASIAATLAIKHLLGLSNDELASTYFVIDVKRFSLDALKAVRRPECRACGLRKFEFLSMRREEVATPVCGTKAVEITPPNNVEVDFNEVSRRVSKEKVVSLSKYTLRVKVGDGIYLTLFKDGRAIVDGTTDPCEALTIYRDVTGLNLPGCRD